MRLVTFDDGGTPRPGVIRDGSVVDLSAAFPNLLAVIDGGQDALAAVSRTATEASAGRPLDEVTLHAPIPTPRRDLWAVGWNYLEHFEEGIGKRGETTVERPEHPAFFTKASTTVIGPGDPIPYDPELSTRMDYEAELAVVIGHAGRSIPEQRALEHVFGYTVANDVTARDIQRRHGGQWVKGKSIDRSCPLGPWIVTAEEVGDPQRTAVRCTLNGDVVQHRPTESMAFPVARLLVELSLGTTLLPGDVILTGTPPGVGYARDPAVWLVPGDEVTVAVDGIGSMTNRVERGSLAAYVSG